MSNTRNVKLGVCSVSFGGFDLGYTKGGVDVTIKTDTHKVQVDQFGTAAVNEYITGRDITIKTPLAEATLTNLSKVMPGSTVSKTGGAAATGVFTFATKPADGDYITVNGLVFKFKTTQSSTGLSTTTDGLGDAIIDQNATANQVVIGAALTNALTAAATAINASADARVGQITVVAGATTLTVTYNSNGVAGNAFKLGASASLTGNVTITPMAGGINDTLRVDVGLSLGTSMLVSAKTLILHPIANAATDLSDDLTIPLANTTGALSYAYALDKERVYTVEFMGYPDPITQELFYVGAPTAGV